MLSTVHVAGLNFLGSMINFARARTSTSLDTNGRLLETVHQMVKLREARLNRTFRALVDQTRRAILTQLEREDRATVSELAERFTIKLPAVMKHLDVLEDAGLITRSKEGRTVTVRLKPDAIRDALSWLQRYERFWSRKLERLAQYAERQEDKTRRRTR